MAGSYNKVFLMGNLTRDPDVKHTGSNKAVANFGLAVNRKYKTADGERREEVTFIDCEAWGYTAENIGKFFAKGRPIFVDGRLRLDTWEDRNDGSKRSKMLVVVENFQFVESKQTTQRDRHDAAAGNGGEFSNDPIPF